MLMGPWSTRAASTASSPSTARPACSMRRQAYGLPTCWPLSAARLPTARPGSRPCCPVPAGSAWAARWPTTCMARTITLLGSFGSHVPLLTLARSDGRVLACSPCQNPELYRASIGGLGLTGLILDVGLQLRRVPGLMLVTEDIKIASLDEFYALSAESEAGWEYTVAWVDCLARGRELGRGIFSRANHAPGPVGPTASLDQRLAVPVSPPWSPLNGFTLRLFNALYRRRLGWRRRARHLAAYAPVLFPLDAIGGWNRLYGRHGFYQYQCVLPPDTARDGIAELLELSGHSGGGLVPGRAQDAGRSALAGPSLLPEARHDPGPRFPEPRPLDTGAARPARSHHARRRRAGLPGQGRSDEPGHVRGRLSRAGPVPRQRRSGLLVVLLAEGGRSSGSTRRVAPQASWPPHDGTRQGGDPRGQLDHRRGLCPALGGARCRALPRRPPCREPRGNRQRPEGAGCGCRDGVGRRPRRYRPACNAAGVPWARRTSC